jgi:6-pyruvoyl tetrahydropterin synthase/QueD family protein
MKMFHISRDYEFSAAHRLEYHPKCGRMHGHNYLLRVEFVAATVDTAGMVRDFAALDNVIKPLVEQLDHHYIISQENIRARDPYVAIANENGDGVQPNIAHSTAELLAKWFGVTIAEAIEAMRVWRDIKVSEVTLWETSRNKATWKPS